jgi:hypothetical protein
MNGGTGPPVRSGEQAHGEGSGDMEEAAGTIGGKPPIETSSMEGASILD